MHTGFENVTPEQKNEFHNYIEGQAPYYGAHPDQFLIYFGQSRDELSAQGQNFYNFSFEREAGHDFGALNLLAKGYSTDTVFMAEDTPELRDLKRKAGQEVLDLLNDGREITFNKPVTEEDLGGRIAVDRYDAGQYHVSKEFYTQFLKVFPDIKKEMEDLTEKVDFMAPRALESPEGKKLLRLSAFCFDIYQELTASDAAKLAMEDTMAVYNENRAPGEHELSYQSLRDFISFASLARIRNNYDLAVDSNVMEGVSSGRLGSVLNHATNLKRSLAFYQENKLKNPNADAFSLLPEKNSEQLIIADMIDPFYEELHKEPGDQAVLNSLLNGSFLKEFKVEVSEAGDPILTAFGRKMDSRDNLVHRPYEDQPPTERRLDQLSAVSAVRNAQDFYNLSAGECFKSITGQDKQAFFENTVQLGYGLTRQTAAGLVLCDLIKNNVSLEDILDPNAALNEKQQASNRLKALIQNHGYSSDSEELKRQKEALDNYAVEVYQAAFPVLNAAVKRATENQEYYDHPNKIVTTKQGGIDFALVSAAFDLNQELSKDRQSRAVQKKDPELLNKILHLGGAAAKFRAFNDLLRGAEQVLTGDTITTGISSVFTARLKEELFTRITHGNVNYDYATEFNHKDPAINASNDQQDAYTKFFSDHLQHAIELRYSREELSAKIADGSLVRDWQVEMRNGQIQSMSMLGVKYDRDLGLKTPEGGELDPRATAAVRERYISEIHRLTEELNKTDAFYLKKKNTTEFNAVRDTLNELDDFAEDISLDSIFNGIHNVKNAVDQYKETHKGEDLSSRQIKRLAIMEQFSTLSFNAALGNKYPDTVETKSAACSNMMVDRMNLAKMTLPENPSGLELLADRAKTSYKNIYNLLSTGREVKPEERQTLLKDLKTVALYKFVEVERLKMGKDGLITNTVNNNKNELDQLVNMMYIDGQDNIQALKNPTRANIEKMFAEKQVDQIVEQVTEGVYQKHKTEIRERKKAQREAEAKRKQSEEKKAPSAPERK